MQRKLIRCSVNLAFNYYYKNSTKITYPCNYVIGLCKTLSFFCTSVYPAVIASRITLVKGGVMNIMSTIYTPEYGRPAYNIRSGCIKGIDEGMNGG
jgi:hypothetical protein